MLKINGLYLRCGDDSHHLNPGGVILPLFQTPKKGRRYGRSFLIEITGLARLAAIQVQRRKMIAFAGFKVLGMAFSSNDSLHRSLEPTSKEKALVASNHLILWTNYLQPTQKGQ